MLVLKFFLYIPDLLKLWYSNRPKDDILLIFYKEIYKEYNSN